MNHSNSTSLAAARALDNPAHARPILLGTTGLPAFEPAIARLTRLVVDERARAMLTHALGVSGWSVSHRGHIEPAHAGELRLRWGVHHANVTIDLAQHQSLASAARSISSGAGAGAESRLRAAVAAILLEPVLRSLATLGMDGVEVAALDVRRRDVHDAHDTHGAPCCAIALQAGAHRFDFILEHVDDGWIDELERIVERQLTPFATHVSQIAVPGRLVIGERTMSVTMLESLRPRDVILRSIAPGIRTLFDAEPTATRLPIVWGRYGTHQLYAMAQIEHHTLTLTEDPRMSYDTHFNAPLTDSVDTPIEINSLDLPLKLEIDTISLPVAQLSALRTGYVIELPTPIVDARIRLVSYGQTIGFGELVTVGENLGVRLVQLSHGHGSV